jgi:hypothetical protein
MVASNLSLITQPGRGGPALVIAMDPNRRRDPQLRPGTVTFIAASVAALLRVGPRPIRRTAPDASASAMERRPDPGAWGAERRFPIYDIMTTWHHVKA